MSPAGPESEPDNWREPCARFRPGPRDADKLAANAGKLALQPRDLRMNRIVRGAGPTDKRLFRHRHPGLRHLPGTRGQRRRRASLLALAGVIFIGMGEELGNGGRFRGPSMGVFFQKARLRPLMPSFRINPIASWRSFAPSRCA